MKINDLYFVSVGLSDDDFADAENDAASAHDIGKDWLLEHFPELEFEGVALPVTDHTLIIGFTGDLDRIKSESPSEFEEANQLKYKKLWTE